MPTHPICQPFPHSLKVKLNYPVRLPSTQIQLLDFSPNCHNSWYGKADAQSRRFLVRKRPKAEADVAKSKT